MHCRLFFILAIMTMIVVSCGTSKNLLTQLRNEADASFAQGDYSTALAKYRQLNLETIAYDSALFRSIAIAAYHVGEYPTTCKFGTKVPTINDEDLLIALSESFDSTSNVVESITLIENNAKIFEQHYGENVIVEKLANYYNENNDTKLIELYPRITSALVRSKCFDTYFKQSKASKTETELLDICKNALKDNQQQVLALDYLAITLYNNADSKYKMAMNDYDKNKNATTYAYLRRDLKRISPMFVEAKNYFEQLRKLRPDELNYVRYLINIYSRLDNKEKVKELKKLL